MRRLAWLALPLMLPALAVAAWWSATSGQESFYFPSLPEIGGGLVDYWRSGQALDDLIPSVAQFAIGFGAALLAGVGLGIAIGLWTPLRRTLTPVTEFMRATPIAAVVPIILLLAGPGGTMVATTVAFGSVWPILVATTDGVRAVDQQAIDTARLYGLNARQRLRVIVLPSAQPQIMAGVRIAVAIGVAALVIAGMFGSTSGLGYATVLAQQRFDVLGTWVGVLVIGALGALINGGYALIQFRMLAWHRGWRGATTASAS